jgi:transposase-like protein
MTKIPEPIVLETVPCPKCGSTNVIRIFRSETGEYTFVCRRCEHTFT